MENVLSKNILSAMKLYSSRGFSRYVKLKEPKLYQEIMEATAHLPSKANLPERAYCVINPDEDYKASQCPHGNRKKFSTWEGGYRHGCASKDKCECLRKRHSETLAGRKFDPETKKSMIEKNKATCIKKYGVDNYAKTDEFKKKFKETNLKRYGVENPSQRDEIKKIVSINHWTKTTQGKKWYEENKEHINNYLDLARTTFRDENQGKNPSQVPEIMDKIRTSRLNISWERLLLFEKCTPNFTKENYKGYGHIYEWICSKCGEKYKEAFTNNK